ncbi:MAG: glycosyltransferase, partial [Desulfurococcaceae archaeon]|nr:glycosyltransferase [Desulfurococcaceae archaeon]
MVHNNVKYLVAIPTLNEAKAIGLVLDEVLSLGVSRDSIVVVDGGSTDGTREAVISRGVKLVDQ